LTVDVPGLIPPDPEGEFVFEVLEYIIQALDRINRLRDRRFEAAFADLGLDMIGYRTLVAAVRTGRCDPPGLAALLGYDESAIQESIGSLTAAGLLKPVDSERSAVSAAITPTDVGQSVYDQTVPIAVRLNDALVEGMDDGERRALLRGLEKMLINLGAGPKDVIRDFYASQIDSGPQA
jgi:DNA-binding MarR family transcriptional regulator